MSDKRTKADQSGSKPGGTASASSQGDLPSERQSQDAVQAYLNEVARTPRPTPGDGRGRLIFAMDATASREPTWDQACQVQGHMFLETAALGGLDVQLVYYRGFNECKASRWVDNPRDLVQLMTSVLCLAGQTKIRRVLQHAVKETERKQVGALVFVGDAFVRLEIPEPSGGRVLTALEIAYVRGTTTIPRTVVHPQHEHDLAADDPVLVFECAGVARVF